MRGRAGRPAAAVALVVLVAVYAALGPDSDRPLRRSVFDLYQQLAPRVEERYPAVVVDIDDQSLAALGQWPWPRTLTARLIEAVAALGPLSIGFDIIMPEPDRLSPGHLATLHPDVDDALRARLVALESNDSVLGRTLARHRVVVARAGVHEAQEGETRPSLTPVMTQGPGDVSAVLAFGSLVVNVPDIEAGASGFGLVNTLRSADGVVRRVPLVMTYRGDPVPSLATELLRLAVGANWLTLSTDERGIAGIQLGESFIASDADGQLTVYFTPPDPRRRVSALDVLEGRLEPGAFTGQVALIGVTGLGLTDVVSTPVHGRMDGVEVHAQVIENIIAGEHLIRPGHALIAEAVAALLVGALIIFLLPRLPVTVGALLVGALVAGAVIAGFAAFVELGSLYDPTGVVGGTLASYFVILGVMLSDANRERRLLDAALEKERIASARMAGELGAAREIQLGMLPDPANVPGLPPTVRLDALLEPAREVGGDLYDLYMIDERRLFVMVGDVSGKGVPASLFMAISKALCRQVTLGSAAAIGEVTSILNEALDRENPAELFVTAVALVLDVTTGSGELCIAGHDAPLVVRPGGEMRSIESAGGPPLCAFGGFDYPTERFELEPGETVVLWTDGVGEAAREEPGEAGKPVSRYYGREGVVRFVQGLAADATPAALVRGLYADVKAFSTDEAGADDITIVAVQYLGDVSGR